MRKLAFLLRPGWVILAAVVVAFAYLCFTVLAPWQLGKNSSTSHRNDLIAKSIDAAPVPVEQLAAAGPDDEWRQVTATGTYQNDATVLVRLRSYEGAPAYDVVTPLRLDNGTTVLVNRGWVGALDGAAMPPIPAAPTGSVQVAGRLRMPEAPLSGRDPITENGYRQVYSLHVPSIEKLTGVDVTDAYLQLSGDQPGVLEPIPLPQLDAGPYLSYGLQWVAFGIMAPLGLAYFIRAELRERRRERGETAAGGRAVHTRPTTSSGESAVRAANADANAANADANAASAAAGATPHTAGCEEPGSDKPARRAQTVAEKLADRYGRR